VDFFYLKGVFMVKSQNLSRTVSNGARYLKRVIKTNGIIETRAIGDRAYFGYFDDSKKFFRTIISDHIRSKIPYGDYPRNGETHFYYTLNKPNPDLFARSANQIKFGRTATGDDEITDYTHLLIDIDPKRPSGVSSTREEKHKAAGVMRRVYRYLRKQGVTALPADSGNGFHLIIPVHYSNTPDTVLKVKNFLLFLHSVFSTPLCDIDTTVWNPSRISKVYGTLAKKGSDIPSRPWRYAQVRFPCPLFPEEKFVDQDLFEIFKDEISSIEKKNDTTINSIASQLDTADHRDVIRNILNSEGFKFREFEKSGRTLFKFKECPVHSGNKNHKYECGITVEPNGQYGAKCFHGDFHWKDFKEAINYNKYTIEKTEVPSWVTTSTDLNLYFNSAEPETATAAESESIQNFVNYYYNVFVYPKIEYLIPDAKLFPRSAVNVIGGEQGVGKSTVVVSMLLAMIRGEPIFGQFNMPKIRVFYLQSDNDADYFMNKISMQFGYDPAIHRDSLLFFHTKSTPGFNPTSSNIFALISSAAPDFDLVVLDNKTSLFPGAVYGNQFGDAQNKSLQLVDEIKKVCIQEKINICSIEHMRKPSNHPWEPCTLHDILGSGTKTAEQVLGLNARFDKHKTLEGTYKNGTPKYSNIFYTRRFGEGVLMGLKNAENLENTQYKIYSDEPYNYLIYDKFEGFTEEATEQYVEHQTGDNKLLNYFITKNLSEFLYEQIAADLRWTLRTVLRHVKDLEALRPGLLGRDKSHGGRGNKTVIKILNRDLLHDKIGENEEPGLKNISTEIDLDSVIDNL
jgi:hypothetical protein